VACNFSCLVETKRLLEVASSHVKVIISRKRYTS